MNRGWYLDRLQAPWSELKGWGLLESNISLPNYLLGGTNVCLDIEIGHMFRKNSPFQTDLHNLLFNELYLIHTVVPDQIERELLVAKLALPNDQITRTAWAMLRRSICAWYRQYLFEEGTRTWDDYKTDWMDPCKVY